HCFYATGESECIPKLVLPQTLHPDQHATTGTLASAPALDTARDRPPSAEIEVADAEVGPIRQAKRLFERGVELGFDVVEDRGHGLVRRPCLCARHPM